MSLRALADGELGDRAARDLVSAVVDAPESAEPGNEADARALDETLAHLSERVAAADALHGAPEVDAAWERLQRALPATGDRATRPLRWLPQAVRGGPGLAVMATGLAAAAAVVLMVAPGDQGRGRPPATGGLDRGAGADGASAGLKGALAAIPRLELLVDAPAGPRALAPAGRASTGDRVVARVQLSEPAWLYLVHRGPSGEAQVVPFSSTRLDAGVHVPLEGGQPVAYSLDGEPGEHTFAVLASQLPLPGRRLKALLDADGPLPEGIARAATVLEAR